MHKCTNTNISVWYQVICVSSWFVPSCCILSVFSCPNCRAQASYAITHFKLTFLSNKLKMCKIWWKKHLSISKLISFFALPLVIFALDRASPRISSHNIHSSDHKIGKISSTKWQKLYLKNPQKIRFFFCKFSPARYIFLQYIFYLFKFNI